MCGGCNQNGPQSSGLAMRVSGKMPRSSQHFVGVPSVEGEGHWGRGIQCQTLEGRWEVQLGDQEVGVAACRPGPGGHMPLGWTRQGARWPHSLAATGLLHWRTKAAPATLAVPAGQGSKWEVHRWDCLRPNPLQVLALGGSWAPVVEVETDFDTTLKLHSKWEEKVKRANDQFACVLKPIPRARRLS